MKVEGGAGSVRLVVSGARGEILIPLAMDICTDIDVGARRIRIDPPEGRAYRVGEGDGPRTIEDRPFVGWLGLLGVLQLLADGGDEADRR